MDLSKTYQKHKFDVTNFKNWLKKHSLYVEKKEILSSNHKQYRESFKWNCLDCGLIFTSELQAQEHFMGKKHQNALKNKALYNSYLDSKINVPGHLSTWRNNMLLRRNFQGPCNSENYLFNNYLEAKNNLNDIIPPPAGRDNILETVIKSERRNFSSTDLSIYRTPSGKYYCQSCDITVNSQAQFIQHSESRKHKHKANRACKVK